MTDRVDRIHLLDKMMASFGTSSIIAKVPSRNLNHHSVITKMKKIWMIIYYSDFSILSPINIEGHILDT